MAILEDVKLGLRIIAGSFDAEINDLISTAKADLKISGVIESKINDAEDMLVKRAIIFYVKANFGLDNSESDKYSKSYEALKTHLCLSKEYTVEEATV